MLITIRIIILKTASKKQYRVPADQPTILQDTIYILFEHNLKGVGSVWKFYYQWESYLL